MRSLLALGIEIRNHNWLTPQYFAMLAKHGVAHIYNSWTHMPSVSEQLKMPGSLTNPQLTGARFLLTPGNTYEKAVKAYSPYKETKQVNEDAREAAAQLIAGGERYEPRTKTFVYVRATRWKRLRRWLAALSLCLVNLDATLTADDQSAPQIPSHTRERPQYERQLNRSMWSDPVCLCARR